MFLHVSWIHSRKGSWWNLFLFFFDFCMNILPREVNNVCATHYMVNVIRCFDSIQLITVGLGLPGPTSQNREEPTYNFFFMGRFLVGQKSPLWIMLFPRVSLHLLFSRANWLNESPLLERRHTSLWTGRPNVQSDTAVDISSSRAFVLGMR